MIKKVLRFFYYDLIAQPLHKLGYKKKYGRWDFFNVLGIETTTHCNLRCEWCPNSKYPRGLKENKKMIDESLFKKVIDELAEIKYGGTIYPFFYGEPLNDERIADLISYTRKKLPKSQIKLSTNGVLLTKEIYQKLSDAGVTKILINQYTPEMLPNVKEILEIDKTAKRKIVEYRIFNYDLRLCNVGGEVKVKNLVERPICTYPDYAPYINYKGDVIICCNDYHGEVVLGNVGKEKLADIWDKPQYKQIRKELKKGIYKLPLCRRCVGLE